MEGYDDPKLLHATNIKFQNARAPLESNSAAKVIDFNELSIGKTIGEGSFGSVRVAQWRGMSVAVKLLKENVASVDKERTEKEKFMEEFKNEIAAMMRVCNHAFVIQLVGVVFLPVPCIVSNYYEYGSIEDLVVKNRLGVRELIGHRNLLQFAVETCLGVRHLHLEGVIHRDLAARNLLLDQNLHVRVSDFGFSRFKERGASKGYTQSSMGPIRWTAPEAMRKRMYSEASDVFSLGVVLYELFVQRMPWTECDTIDVAVRVCSGERMDVPSTVAPGVRQVMYDCWSQDPSARPDLSAVADILTAEKESSVPDNDGSFPLALSRAIQSLSSAGPPSEVIAEEQYAQFSSLTSPISPPDLFLANSEEGSLWSGTSSGLSAATETPLLSSGTADSIIFIATQESSTGPPRAGRDDRDTGGEYVLPHTTSLLTQTDTLKMTDAQFLASFRAGDLRSWGHESLLRVIYLLLQEKGRSGSTVSEIITCLQSFQKDEFHMTLTYFWIQLITYAIEICKQDVMMAVFDVDNSGSRLLQLSFMEFILQPHCARLRDSQLYLQFYSDELMDSGKIEFRLPDLQTFPSVLNRHQKSK